MKRLVALVGCAVFLLVLAGCKQQDERMSSQPQLESKTQDEVLHEVWDGEPQDEVLPDFFGDQTQRSVFPEFLVGTWKADRYDWAFKFEPDGSISHLVHMLWALRIDVKEGGVYVKSKFEDSYAVFVIGPCEADYNPTTRELSVKIIMDYYEIKTPVGSLEGRSEDYFQGPVSEDGKTWKVEWRNYGYLDGATLPDIDYIDANPEPLVFTKLDIK